MFREVFLQNIWVVIILWSIVYISDYTLTIIGARFYHAHLERYIEYEGSYELTPAFQRDIDQLRIFSPVFIQRLLLSFLLISLIWWLSVRFLGMPQFFYFAIGALFLREAVVHLRHIRLIAMAVFSKDPSGMHGKIEYARWLNLKLSGTELISFGLFFLLISILSESWFYLGGCAASISTGISHWRWSKKHYMSVQEETRLVS